MPTPLSTLVDFVEGRLETSAFEKLLYQDGALEQFLSSQNAPKYAHTGHTLYHYLIALNYRNPGDTRTAQGALADVLHEMGVAAVVFKRTSELLDLIYSAQPKWLDADAAFVQSLLEEAPSFEKKSEIKNWLRLRLLEVFRYVKKPPAWLQSPNWPMGKNGPLVFLGQVSVDGYFHDTAAAYVFHDSESKECVTVLQTR